MALAIATNTGALMAAASATSVNRDMETSMERLSTGKRINSAKDDAAGVAIASRLTSEIRGTNQAIRNAQDAQGLINTAEGAHKEIENILQRMRELAVQGANDTNSADDRSNLQAEMSQLVEEIDRISSVSSWAGQTLIDQANTFKFQVGARGTSSDAANEISVTMNAMSSAALSVGAGNAAVGANGATLTAVGAQVLQVGGTPVVGDTYEFTLNGDALAVEITADDGTNFSFAFSINGTAVTSSVTANTVDTGDITGTGGNDAHAVAKAIAGLVNAVGDASDGGTQGEMTATAAADGSVTLQQKVVVTATANYDESTTGDGTLDIAGVFDSSANTITFTDLENATFAATDDFVLNINGVALGFTDMDTDFAASSDGFLAAVQSQLDANADNLKGLTNLTAAYNAGNDLVISFTPATTLTDVSATAGQSSDALSISTQADASAAIATIDAAIITVNTQRANLGAVSNRLDNTVNNLTNISANLEGGRGRIEDADFAAESTSLAKSQILQQASTAMLAQANASKQSVLSLLQG